MLLLCVRVIVVHAWYALPSVNINCDVSMSTVHTRNRITCLGISKSVRRLNTWMGAALPSRLRIWSRETGSAVPSRVSLLISIPRLNLVLLTYGVPPEFRGGV